MDDRLRIKELAEEDRPREKMRLKGAAALSDAELIAILIGSGSSTETAVQLSQRILGTVDNSLGRLARLTVDELMAFRGIGEAKAITIAAAMELGRRKGLTNDDADRDTIRSSAEAFRLFHPHLCDLPHEELWAAFTNRSAKVIARTMISRGGTDHTSADVLIVLKAAINNLCAGIVLCHNHPSGDPRPSRQDDALTDRIARAATLLGIQLIDHIILCDKRYYSYADEGRLPRT